MIVLLHLRNLELTLSNADIHNCSPVRSNAFNQAISKIPRALLPALEGPADFPDGHDDCTGFPADPFPIYRLYPKVHMDRGNRPILFRLDHYDRLHDCRAGWYPF